MLEEIGKTLQAVDQAISVFLSLGIDKAALQKNSKLLLDIESGGLSTAIERGRGHCHVIGNIYTTHLDRWFEQALKPDEYHIVQGVFAELGNADNDLFHTLAE